MEQLTPDIWYVTCDIRHVSRDTQGVMTIVSKFQVPSSYGLGVLKIMNKRITNFNELMNAKGVCRTAPATLGLVMIVWNWKKHPFPVISLWPTNHFAVTKFLCVFLAGIIGGLASTWAIKKLVRGWVFEFYLMLQSKSLDNQNFEKTIFWYQLQNSHV